MFIGKSGAILLGYPDTTQDADLFVDKSPANCSAVVAGLRSLVSTAFMGFGLWVHHMFATGLPQLGESFFTAASIIIAIPSCLTEVDENDIIQAFEKVLNERLPA